MGWGTEGHSLAQGPNIHDTYIHHIVPFHNNILHAKFHEHSSKNKKAAKLGILRAAVWPAGHMNIINAYVILFNFI